MVAGTVDAVSGLLFGVENCELAEVAAVAESRLTPAELIAGP